MKKKATVIFGIILAVILISIAIYKFNTYRIYSSLLQDATEYMNQGEYDKALSLFESCLKYRTDSNIDMNIALAKELKESKISYETALNQMKDKKYLEAINSFNKVSKKDTTRYNEAQKQIDQCKKQYLSLNLEAAKSATNSKKYDTANEYLNNVLKLDKNNAEAEKLKTEIASAIANEKNAQNNDDSEKQQVSKDDSQSTSSNGRSLTSQDATNIIKNKFPSNSSNIIYSYDHDSKHDGKDFYVIHVYESVQTHTATIGWYGVEKNSGRIYDELLNQYIN